MNFKRNNKISQPCFDCNQLIWFWHRWHTCSKPFAANIFSFRIFFWIYIGGHFYQTQVLLYILQSPWKKNHEYQIHVFNLFYFTKFSLMLCVDSRRNSPYSEYPLKFSATVHPWDGWILSKNVILKSEYHMQVFADTWRKVVLFFIFI